MPPIGERSINPGKDPEQRLRSCEGNLLGRERRVRQVELKRVTCEQMREEDVPLLRAVTVLGAAGENRCGLIEEL